ncbi:MAG: hypothetical protein U1E29_02095 [Coriobacteriia bacterium]|nr:hypothetical protein [Coriobacteriia bacterium]
MGGLRLYLSELTQTLFSNPGVLVSCVALLVSVYAASQSQRAAAANEKMAQVSENQARPWIRATQTQARIDGKAYVIHLQLENIGRIPVVVREVRVNVYKTWGTKAQIDGSILYPGETCKVALRAKRWFSPSPEHNIDVFRLSPSEFTFKLSYAAHGVPSSVYTDSFRKSALMWVDH